jgi:GTPase SAR1 family protein
MKLVCRNKDCTLAEGGVCARGEEFEDPLTECPELVRTSPQTGVGAPVAEAKKENPTPIIRDAANSAPWSGRHLSEPEADRLMNSSPARVFGIVGPPSAGKTCLITSLFLQLADGQCERLGYRFASSQTLFSLQTLCRELAEWDGHSGGPMVAHTHTGESSEAGSFIHLGLRPGTPGDNRHIDVLLGDMAGEHFSKFTSLADEQTIRRMAFLRRCDGFILVVDAMALFSEKGRRLDSELARMLERLLDTLGESGRTDAPIAVVLSKIDAVEKMPLPRPSPETASSRELAEAFKRRAPRLATVLRRADEAQVPHQLFAVSAIPPDGQPYGVQEPFRYLLSYADGQDTWPLWVPPIADGPVSSYMAMRTWRNER